MAASGPRIPVDKTYKIYIDGKFPRTESGRYFALENPEGEIAPGFRMRLSTRRSRASSMAYSSTRDTFAAPVRACWYRNQWPTR